MGSATAMTAASLVGPGCQRREHYRRLHGFKALYYCNIYEKYGIHRDCDYPERPQRRTKRRGRPRKVNVRMEEQS